MPIKKSDVDGMQPNFTIWDSGKGSVSGFGVRRQARYPSFFLKCRIQGKQRWYTIGRYGAPWTVEQARLEAKKILGQLMGGQDPKNNKLDSRAISVSDFCDIYMQAARSGSILTRFNRPKKESTLNIDVGRIDRHIRPLIGSFMLSDVDRHVVSGMIRDITNGITAFDGKTKRRGRSIVKGGKGTAARVADLLSGIFSWAIEEGYVQLNPVHGVRRYRGAPRERFLNSDELRELGAVLSRGVDSSGRSFHPFAVKIIQLLCLTGCRLNEVVGLRWSEVDLENSCLRLEDTKTGRSLRAIGTAAVDTLKLQPHVGNEFLFPGRTGLPYQGMKTEARRIFTAARITGGSSHVLRHTYASIAAELGYADGTIGGLLGHAGRGVTSRYIHRPDKSLVLAADAVAAEIERQLGWKGIAMSSR